MNRRRIFPWTIAIGLIFWAPTLYAHAAAFHGPDSLAGALNYLSGIEYLLGSTAMGLLAGQRGRDAIALGFVTLGAGLFLGVLLSGHTAVISFAGMANLGAVAILGALVALRLPLPRTVVAAAGSVLGLVQGYANGLAVSVSTSEVTFVPGVVAAGLLIMTLSSALALAARASWQHIAVRTAGSWITAIGLIAVAVQFASGSALGPAVAPLSHTWDDLPLTTAADISMTNGGVHARMLTVLLVGFLIGLQHAMEPDHLAAVASLTTQGRSVSHVIKQGAAWGLGHGLTLLIFGGVVLLLNAAVPERLAAALNLAVALMLILLGADVLRRLWGDRAQAHHGGIFHRHGHEQAHGDDSCPAPDGHSQSGKLPLRALVVGMMHGLAGSAALVVLALNAVGTPLEGFLYILLFGAGSIIGMVVLAAVISLPLRYSADSLTGMHNVLQLLIGASTIGLGILIAYRIVA